MKTIIAIMFMISALPAMANVVEGTLVLKGSLKTKIMVNGVKTTCKVRVKEVKNLLEEDYYGNPAYKIDVEVSLSGSDFARGLKVKLNNDYRMTNLFNENGQSMVKDLQYASKDGATLFINRDGRLKEVIVSFENKKVSCTFQTKQIGIGAKLSPYTCFKWPFLPQTEKTFYPIKITHIMNPNLYISMEGDSL